MNEFLKSTNPETKKYIINALNLIDWFNKNKDNVSIDGKEMSDADKIAISFFLSAIRHSDELKELFSKHNISYNNYFEFFNNLFEDNYEVYPIDKTNIYNSYDFGHISNDFLSRLKRRLETEEVLYVEDIEIYQILYYFMDTAWPNIKKITTLLSNYNEEELFNDLYELVSKKDEIFIDKLKHKDAQKIEFKDVILFFHKDFSITFKLKDNLKRIPLKFCGSDTSLELENEVFVTLINNEDASVDSFHDAFEQDTININFYDSINDKDIQLSCDTLSLFNVDEKKNDNISSNNSDLENPNLEKYGKELTSDYFLKDPSIGREDEIKRIEQILLYPEKDKSIVIVGEAGCGKTALVRGLAYRIQNGNVPKALKNIKIYAINTSSLVAGTKYVGTLEDRMKKILDEASKDKNIIIFIDEIHQAIGGGKSEGNNNTVSEILKPYIDYGDVRIISATTDYEYNEYIAQDQAFKTRLKKVKICEPNDYVIYEILDDLINKYDEISYSKLKRSNEEKDMIIKWLIESTNKKFRSYNDKASNPRLVLDILKEAYAIAAINDRELVLNEDLCEALMNEDRLYESSRINQCKKLKNMTIKKNDTKILKFIPKK